MHSLRPCLTVFVIVFALCIGATQSAEGGFREGLAAARRGDFATALREYRPLAERGNKFAQFNLGVMYFKGDGVLKDDKEAVKWYRKAANQGFAKAQYMMGQMYRRGEGVLKDIKEAAKWYRKAANQGYARAQNNLGYMYETGYGVLKDNKEAFKWYTKAANQGYARAQYNLRKLKSKKKTVSSRTRTSTRTNNSTIDGYKEIKFGMTLQEINNLGVCSKTLNIVHIRNMNMCYSIIGQKREFIFGFVKGNRGLKMITINFGRYVPSLHNQIRRILDQKYKKYYRGTKTDSDRFRSGQLQVFKDAWENGQVVLTIKRVSYFTEKSVFKGWNSTGGKNYGTQTGTATVIQTRLIYADKEMAGIFRKIISQESIKKSDF
ncbi:MAG: tetratricopeptide repeat protein [Nitrospinota bacterium]|nr:tetratricopeptide repeat protein [Nitrospinota bacterium]